MDPLEYRSNVRHIASHFLGRGLDRDDLRSIGDLAMLKAARTHAANRHDDATFAGYIAPTIRRDIVRALEAEARSPRACTAAIEDVPDARRDDEADEEEDTAARILGLLTDRQARAVELHLGLDGSPGRSAGEVADMMGLCSVGNAERLIKTGLAILKSGQRSPGHHQAGGSTGPRALRQSRLGRIGRDERDRLLGAVDSLPETWRRVIRERYLAEPPRLHKEIAADLGVTASRVGQIERKALDRLAQTLSSSSTGKP